MKILFAAPENAWGGSLGILKAALPQHEFMATGHFGFDSLAGYDVLIPTMARVTREDIRKSDRLKLIQQLGAGLEGVDIEAAHEKGILVANVPTDISGNADAVAELGIYMMIGLSRHFRELEESFRKRVIGHPPGKALSGKTAGIIGLGGIGRALVKRLGGFNMRLIGIKRRDIEKTKDELSLEWAGTPDRINELLSRSDYVLLCLPLTAESRHMIGKREFDHMKKDAFIINLSRGPLIDKSALEEALREGKIAGAGMDVFWEEPPDPDDPVFKYNIMVTPHVAASTDVSTRGIVAGVIENIRRLESGKMPLNTR